jgi:DNA polymerase-1
MVDAFRKGIDIHWKTTLSELERYVGQSELVIATASKLAKRKVRYAEAIEILMKAGPGAASDIDNTWGEMRKKAKAINFGYVYGMWWKKFILYARDNYGLKLTPEEAQRSRINFFQLYPLEDWHRKQQRYARSNGYVRSFSGRKRRLPQAMMAYDTPERAEAWRQAINSPIQGFASDLNLMVLLQIREEFSRDIVQPIITVHDSILIEVRTKHIPEVSRRIEEIMRKPKLLNEFGIDFTVPIMGETKIGPWGKSVSLRRWEAEH